MVPFGESLLGEDGREHFFYTLDRAFWVPRMRKLYPNKEIRPLVPGSMDGSTDSGGETPGSVPGQEELESGQKTSSLLDGALMSRVEHEKELKEWKELYYHERGERMHERAERQALIQENIKLNNLLLAEPVKPKETVESPDGGGGQGADNPPPPESTAQQSHEAHGQESE